MDLSQSSSAVSVVSVLPAAPAIGGGIMDATLSIMVPPPTGQGDNVKDNIMMLLVNTLQVCNI